MNKRVLLILKLAILAIVVVVVGREFAKAWRDPAWQDVAAHHLSIQWPWGLLAILGFCGSMATSALVWRWLAWQMGDRARRLPTLPLLGAYTFSQMGKYFPGKVALLLMRIERAGRFGMPAGVCTLSTLLENALYLISGGLVGMTAVLRILSELRAQGKISAAAQNLQWPVLIVTIAVLAVACHPAVFYTLINKMLRRMKKPEVPREQRLRTASIGLAILGFVPCWFFGGAALWASTRCLYAVDPWSCLWFAGAYALSVILGMVFLTPGGLGVREMVLGTAVALQLSPIVGHSQAVVLGTIAAVLQRLFQILAEVLLGMVGAILTGVGKRVETPPLKAELRPGEGTSS